MKTLWVLGLAAIALAACSREQSTPAKEDLRMVLKVSWRRLVTESGQTCDRCASTEEELHKAVITLQESLRPLGIAVESAETVLTPAEFTEDMMASNRILIGDRTVEEWLGGEVGRSQCESCCSAVGESVECRTVEVNGTTYETVPAELIVRAGLVAAAELLQSPSSRSCCPEGEGAKERDKPCCPGEAPDDGASR